jgi:hypothetical protein
LAGLESYQGLRVGVSFNDWFPGFNIFNNPRFAGVCALSHCLVLSHLCGLFQAPENIGKANGFFPGIFCRAGSGYGSGQRFGGIVKPHHYRCQVGHIGRARGGAGLWHGSGFLFDWFSVQDSAPFFGYFVLRGVPA